MQGTYGKVSRQEEGGSIMATSREILKIIGIAGLTLLIGQGCSQKSVRVTADSETFEQGASYAENRTGAGNQAGADNPFSQGYQQGSGEGQTSANAGGQYFGADQNSMDSWQNSGPLAGLQEYGSGNQGGWGSGQGGNMAEEFIQGDYDNIAEAQQGQYGRGGHHSQVQVELQDVFFEYDSWRISQDGREALANDVDWLEQNQSRSITVEGHCDQRGTRDYNLVLGKKRAGAVRAYLVDLGVDSHKIQVMSYGKERPFCFGNNDQCYQLNRRGHLQLHH